MKETNKPCGQEVGLGHVCGVISPLVTSSLSIYQTLASLFHRCFDYPRTQKTSDFREGGIIDNKFSLISPSIQLAQEIPSADV